jgi:hypothetical protein
VGGIHPYLFYDIWITGPAFDFDVFHSTHFSVRCQEDFGGILTCKSSSQPQNGKEEQYPNKAGSSKAWGIKK